MLTVTLSVRLRSNSLARIIKTGSAGKDRKMYEKSIVIAIRELMKQSNLDKNTYDLVAYIALALKAIGETVDESVAAWEKRGYWLKADHYRMEWNWTTRLGEDLQKALQKEDWGRVASLSAQVSQKLSKVKVSQNHRLGEPWIGAWGKLIGPNKGH